MMLFPEEFLASLKDDPVAGTITICQNARMELRQDEEGWSQYDYDVLIEAWALIVELAEAKLLPVEIGIYEFTGDISTDCYQILNRLSAIEENCISQASRLRLASLRSHFKTSLGTGFCYEFSQGDMERIQVLVNQLRDLISNGSHLEKDHQLRLLKRLEKLQAEIHKKVSDLDRFWGLIGDAGVVLGKLGTDAKPIVDRVREIADIVWQTQARSEELPSGTRLALLEHKASDDER